MSLGDYLIIAGYFGLIIAVGLRCSGRQRSLKAFLLAENDIPWWAAAFSGIATVVSGVSYLGAPGQAFSSNFTYHQLRLGIPLALAVLCLVMLPILFRLKISSIYEYLERRFDARIRLLASGLFVLSKLGYLAVVVYAPSLVVAELTQLPIVSVILITGMVTAAYTLVGGMKAVIWTDSLQLGVLLAGIAAVLMIAIPGVPRGLAGVWETAEAAGRLQLVDFSLDPRVTYTFWSGMIGGAFMLISQWGSDQAEVQRFLTTKSVRQANVAMITSVVVATGVGVTMFFVGTTLFAFYTAHPEKGGLLVEPNRILARFIIDELPFGLRGLLIAGVLAASMSTISSVLNSLATVVISDFLPRVRRRPATLTDARWLTLLFGALVTGLACFGGSFGNLLDASVRVINLFAGSLAGIFLLGMLSRRASARGAFWGTLLGLAVVMYLNFGTNVSFLWFAPVSAFVAFASGMALSVRDPHRGIIAAELVFDRRANAAVRTEP
jgi:solute:Na+ symporter, SSS family